jgi:hypothetical protein
MRLNPEATKASSNLKDVRSSTVQPKTFPPNASGATSNPELPKLRLLIFFGGSRCPNRASILIKTPANLRLDGFFPCEGTRCDKSCSTLKEGGAVSSFSATQTLAKVGMSRADDVWYINR